MTQTQGMTTQTALTASRLINAPAADIFDLLSLPDRHPSFDGSGFVRSADHPQRIQQVGDVFRMNMEGDHMGGEYQTDNVVTGFQPNKLIAWKTAPAGTEPPGWEWLYELEPEGSDTTRVTLTYDWSGVTDKATLKQVPFPLVSQDEIEGSLASLAAVANG
jgi:uncharacterized protein YndB with AHSA1/START domain